MEKIALVTGATRGIGNAIARQLIGKGFRVVVTGRDQEQAEKVAKELGQNAVPFRVDVVDDESVASLEKFMNENFDRLDVLVNNAAVIDTRPALDFDLGRFRWVLETNFYGLLRITKSMLPLLKRSQDARIINMSSGMGTLNDLRRGGHAAYRMSKLMVNGITIQLAGELSDTGIKVNAMSPGWVKTDMGGPDAPLTADQGADTAVWLATEKNIPSGKFFAQRKEKSW